MTALHDLQRTRPGSPERVRPTAVAAAMAMVARWLKANRVPVEHAMTAIDGAAPEIERAFSADGDLMLVILTASGLIVLSGDDAWLEAAAAQAEEFGAPVLGLNPALIERTAWSIATKGGADAQGRLH